MSIENFNKLHFNLLDRVKSLEENPGSLPGGGEDNSILIKNVKIKTGNLPIIGDPLTKIYVNRKTIVNDSSLFQLISQLEDVDCPYFKVNVLEDEYYIGLGKSSVAENIYQFIVCEGWGKCDQGFLINPTDQDIEYPYTQMTMPAHSLFRIRYDEEEGYGPVVEQVFEDLPELKIASDNEAVISEVSENWGTLVSKHLSINEPFEIEEGLDWKKLEKSISGLGKGTEGVLTKTTSKDSSSRQFKDSYTKEDFIEFLTSNNSDDVEIWDDIYYLSAHSNNYWDGNQDITYFEIYLDHYDEETGEYFTDANYICGCPYIGEDGWYLYNYNVLLTNPPELIIPKTEDEIYYENISDISELDVLFDIIGNEKKLKPHYSEEELANFLGEYDWKGFTSDSGNFFRVNVSHNESRDEYQIDYGIDGFNIHCYHYYINADIFENGWYQEEEYIPTNKPAANVLNFLNNPVGELLIYYNGTGETLPANGDEFDELLNTNQDIIFKWSKIPEAKGGVPEYSDKDMGSYLGVEGPSKSLTFKDSIDISDLENLASYIDEVQFYRGSGHIANMYIQYEDDILSLIWERIGSPDKRYMYFPEDTEFEGMYIEKGWYNYNLTKLSEGPMTDIDTTDEGIDVSYYDKSGEYFSTSISEFINISKFKRLFKTESYLKWVDLKKWDDEIDVILPFKYYDNETDSWKIMYISTSSTDCPITWETFINHCDHPEVFSYSADDEILFNNNRLTGKDIGNQYRHSPINYDIMYIEERGE